MGRRRSTFVDFIDKNENLTKEYEQVIGEDIWSLPIQKIEEIAGAIASKMKIGFNSVLNNCINISIQTQTPLLKVLSNVLKSDSELFNNDSSLQKYFKEINQIYIQNNNEYDIPFTPENRDKIISMNLKSVIAIAKCYQGLGVEFQDLISAGNEGLCRAFNKFDPKRSCLKDDVKKAINDFPRDKMEYKELLSVINEFLTYGETIKKSFDLKFKENTIYTKEDILKWVDKNISNAKFNSVACKWIKAYIIQEINNNSRIVKKPKTEINRDKENTGAYQKEVIVNIDAPISMDENSKTIGEMLMFEDDSAEHNALENEENYKLFKTALNILLTGVKSRDRRIMLKKFGIGIIRPLQPNEIAIQEDLSVARISQIINATLETMIANAKRYKDKLDENNLFDIISKLL